MRIRVGHHGWRDEGPSSAGGAGTGGTLDFSRPASPPAHVPPAKGRGDAMRKFMDAHYRAMHKDAS